VSTTPAGFPHGHTDIQVLLLHRLQRRVPWATPGRRWTPTPHLQPRRRRAGRHRRHAHRLRRWG